MNVFDKFTNHSKKALETAYLFAVRNNHAIDIEHILLGITKEKGSIGYDILQKIHSNSAIADRIISQSKNKKQGRKKMKPVFALGAIAALERAALLASSHMHPYIGTEHILFSILSYESEKIQRLFQKEHIDIKEMKNRLELVFKSTSKFPQMSGMLNNFSRRMDDLGIFDPVLENTQKKSYLELFATHLSDKKNQKNIDPVIGREDEIQRIIQILSRRTKNNPLLLGDPGVGKTAIVEGLAKKILLGEVPQALLHKKIYALDLGLLIAGSSFRGEFEQRLKQILIEIKQNPNIILFIDEIHNIIGAGSAMGAMDAANILKPSLARGEIRCIGATTSEEYKKHIENDAAFERRFQIVHIAEPSVEKTIDILFGIKENYEKFHHVFITDEAIQAAAKLSYRYIQDKFLPDKAIDCIDEAASSIKIQKGMHPLEQNMQELEDKYNSIIEMKKQAVINEEYDTALNFRAEEDALLKKISELKNLLSLENKKIEGRITEKHIREAISRASRIPMDDLNEEERNKWMTLEKKISEKIIGQNEAVHTLSQHLKRSWAGISDRSRPLGSFIFLGPSGVGKTELAKILAETIFHHQKSLIRVDMSEFSESFNISKLIGSPAGYVGYKDANLLTDRVKKQPYSLVLLDEIEKAHPQIFNIMLQILEDGNLTDASGKTVSFRNTIIIMTSNLGTEDFNKTASMGFGEKGDEATNQTFESTKKNVLEKLTKFFKQEFLNRIDKTIVFKPLGSESIQNIVNLQIKDLGKRLSEKNIELNYDSKVTQWIADKSYAPHLGARAIRNTISEHIETPMADFLLSKPKSETRGLHISLKSGKIEIE